MKSFYIVKINGTYVGSFLTDKLAQVFANLKSKKGDTVEVLAYSVGD